jgi:hypothetical protein
MAEKDFHISEKYNFRHALNQAICVKFILHPSQKQIKLKKRYFCGAKTPPFGQII